MTVYERAPRFDGALVLGISQSGASPDIVAVLAEARRQGALTAVVTNKTESDLARQGDVVMNLMAGEEKAVAATKTYTAELAAIALLSAFLSGEDEAMAALEHCAGGRVCPRSLGEADSRDPDAPSASATSSTQS